MTYDRRIPFCIDYFPKQKIIDIQMSYFPTCSTWFSADYEQIIIFYAEFIVWYTLYHIENGWNMNFAKLQWFDKKQLMDMINLDWSFVSWY